MRFDPVAFVTGGHAASTAALLRGAGIVGPLATAAFALLLLTFLRSGNVSDLVISEDGYGPYSWPKFMLIGIVVSALALAIKRWRDFANRGRGVAADATTEVLGAPVSRRRDMIGAFVAVVAYGMLQETIGFAFDTFLFLVAWMALASRRGIMTILASSSAATIGLLYLFVKVAYLPLPKGNFFFDDLTVMLYRFLRIF